MCGICLQNRLVSLEISVNSLAAQVVRSPEAVYQWLEGRCYPHQAGRDAVLRITGIRLPRRSRWCRQHRQEPWPRVVPRGTPLVPYSSESPPQEEATRSALAVVDEPIDGVETEPALSGDNGHHRTNGTADESAPTGNGNGAGASSNPEHQTGLALTSAELYRRSDEALNLAAELHSLAMQLQAQGL